MIKKMCVAALVGLATCLPIEGFSQWLYNYTSLPGGYSYTNTGVAVSADKVNFSNATGNAFRRIWYPIDYPSYTSLTNRFRMDFDFLYTPNGSGNGMAHWLAAATSSTMDPTCIIISPPTTSSVDVIGVKFESPSDVSPANAAVSIGTKHGTVSTNSSGILLNANYPYYITLERLSAGTIKLSVFLDAGRTAHAPGSPICYSGFDPATGTGAASLKYLQHGVVAWAGVQRTLSGYIDRLRLDTIPPSPVLTASPSQTLCVPGAIPDPFTAYFNPTPGFVASYQWQQFTVAFPSSGWHNISGATQQTYTPTGVGLYQCICTVGCTTTYTSNVVTISLNSFNPHIDCDVIDIYSTGSPVWTQTGTDVSINTLMGYCSFKATADAPNPHRVTRNIGFLPNDKWRADFDFAYNGLGSTNPHHYIAAFTNNNAQPMVTSQDVIYAQVATTSTGAVQIWGGSRDGAGSSIVYSSATGIAISTGTFYVSVERLCSTKGRISVFTDAGRTTHAAGSPQYFDIDATVTSLTYLQHSNDVNYLPGSRLTADIDNLCIDNNYQFGGHRMANSTGDEESTETLAKSNFSVYPNPSADIFTVTLDKMTNGLIEVYNISGKKVKSMELNQGSMDYKLDLSDHSKGIYMINIISNDKIQSKKIILE